MSVAIEDFIPNDNLCYHFKSNSLFKNERRMIHTCRWLYFGLFQNKNKQYIDLNMSNYSSDHLLEYVGMELWGKPSAALNGYMFPRFVSKQNIKFFGGFQENVFIERETFDVFNLPENFQKFLTACDNIHKTSLNGAKIGQYFYRVANNKLKKDKWVYVQLPSYATTGMDLNDTGSVYFIPMMRIFILSIKGFDEHNDTSNYETYDAYRVACKQVIENDSSNKKEVIQHKINGLLKIEPFHVIKGEKNNNSSNYMSDIENLMKDVDTDIITPLTQKKGKPGVFYTYCEIYIPYSDSYIKTSSRRPSYVDLLKTWFKTSWKYAVQTNFEFLNFDFQWRVMDDGTIKNINLFTAHDQVQKTSYDEHNRNRGFLIRPSNVLGYDTQISNALTAAKKLSFWSSSVKVFNKLPSTNIRSKTDPPLMRLYARARSVNKYINSEYLLNMWQNDAYAEDMVNNLMVMLYFDVDRKRLIPWHVKILPFYKYVLSSSLSGELYRFVKHMNETGASNILYKMIIKQLIKGRKCLMLICGLLSVSNIYKSSWLESSLSKLLFSIGFDDSLSHEFATFTGLINMFNDDYNYTVLQQYNVISRDNLVKYDMNKKKKMFIYVDETTISKTQKKRIATQKATTKKRLLNDVKKINENKATLTDAFIIEHFGGETATIFYGYTVKKYDVKFGSYVDEYEDEYEDIRKVLPSYVTETKGIYDAKTKEYSKEAKIIHTYYKYVLELFTDDVLLDYVSKKTEPIVLTMENAKMLVAYKKYKTLLHLLETNQVELDKCDLLSHIKKHINGIKSAGRVILKKKESIVLYEDSNNRFYNIRPIFLNESKVLGQVSANVPVSDKAFESNTYVMYWDWKSQGDKYAKLLNDYSKKDFPQGKLWDALSVDEHLAFILNQKNKYKNWDYDINTKRKITLMVKKNFKNFIKYVKLIQKEDLMSKRPRAILTTKEGNYMIRDLFSKFIDKQIFVKKINEFSKKGVRVFVDRVFKRTIENNDDFQYLMVSDIMEMLKLTDDGYFIATSGKILKIIDGFLCDDLNLKNGGSLHFISKTYWETNMDSRLIRNRLFLKFKQDSFYPLQRCNRYIGSSTLTDDNNGYIEDMVIDFLEKYKETRNLEKKR